MSDGDYTFKTAALKSVVVDSKIGNFDILNVKGKNINELIKENSFDLPKDIEKIIYNIDINNKYCRIIDKNGILIHSNVESVIEDGSYMYNGTIAIDLDGVYNTPLPKLKNGFAMFSCCNGKSNAKTKDYLVKFESDVPELINGENMFAGNIHLVSVKSNMPKLENGNFMFGVGFIGEYYEYYCSSLTYFEGDLSSLKNGNSMFAGSGLETFKSSLPSLEKGDYMFDRCNLNKESVIRILTSLKNDNKLEEGKSANIMLSCPSCSSEDSDINSLLESGNVITTKNGGKWNITIATI